MVGFTFASSGARADDTTFALAWQTGAGACVTEAAIRAGVEKKLGRSPFTDRESADVVIEGEESVGPRRFRARVRQRDRHGRVLGSRELEAESCASLIRTTTIVVALFIELDDERELPPVASEGAAPPPTPANESVVERAPAPDRPARPRPPDLARAPALPPWKRPFELSLGAGGAAAFGLLPSPSGAIRVVARLEHTRSRWSFEWSAGYSLPQTVRNGRVRGTFSAVDQQLRACLAAVEAHEIRFDVCGGVFWGAIIVETTGVQDPSEAWRSVVGPSAAVALALHKGAGAVRLDLGFTTPLLQRAPYYLNTQGEPERFYATSRVIVFVGLSGALTIL